jgi:hypothetical protein
MDVVFPRSYARWRMKSGENKHMQQVEEAVEEFIGHNPPPEGLELRWSGLTYINKVWQGSWW